MAKKLGKTWAVEDVKGLACPWGFWIRYSWGIVMEGGGYRSKEEASRACRRTAKRFGIRLVDYPADYPSD